MKGLFLGAYASSPSPAFSVWNAGEEERYIAGLRALEGVAGIEHPFFGELHRWDEASFLKNLDPRWDVALTCIPGVMPLLRQDPVFGLASTSPEGRRRALDFTRAALTAVKKLNSHFGRAAVPAVAVHSAPRGSAGSSREAFRESLDELRGWDWQGATLMVEHCDRWRDDQKWDKGFLSLEDELWALGQTAGAGAAPAGSLINWGRSAVEARSAAGPLAHIKAGKAAGLLGGLMFSGVTRKHPLFGDFVDSHAPFQADEPASLMGEEETRACLQAAQWEELDLLGFKIAARPDEAPIEFKLALMGASLRRLQACLKVEAA